MRTSIIALAVLALAGCGSSSSGTSGSSGSSGSPSTSGGSGSGSSGTSGATAADVLQQHKDDARTGVYVDAAFTKANIASIHPDEAFAPTYSGPTYAQPLYVSGASRDLVIVATEQNDVHAFDASDGGEIWSQNLGAPWPLSDLPCGNVDPLGITGTPVIDAATRTLYVDAMVHDTGHQVFALDVDTGAVKSGWPVSLEGAVTSNGVTFDSHVQNQRGALALHGTTLFVPFGGHWGDCGSYHGWLIAIDVNSRALSGWATRAVGGGIWAPGGVVLDGAHPYVATGNTFGASTWSDGEAVIELGTDGSFDPASGNYYAPTDWKYLDANDIDMSGTAPLLFDVGSRRAALALGKDGKAYYLDRDALGGIGGGLDIEQVSGDEIINSAAYFFDGQKEHVYFVSQPSCASGSGDLGELVVDPSASPIVQNGWCADEGDALPGGGTPIITSPDGRSDWVVWGVGAGDANGNGDGKLRAWDALSGQPLYDGSTSLTDPVRRFEAPIVAKGKLYIAGESRLERYALP